MSYNDLRKGRRSEPRREYLVTSVTFERRPIFADLYCARIFIRELRRIENEELCRWLAWVVMPDHFHGLLSLGENESLSSLMRYLKARSARKIQRYRGVTGKVWQPNFHDRALRKEDQRIAIARYIVANPLRAGLVKTIGGYPNWDSIWL